MLHNHGRMQVFGQMLDAVHRGQRLRTAAVVGRDEPFASVLLKLEGIAGENDKALLPQMNQQGLMAWSVAWSCQDAHGAVAKNIVVAIEQMQLCFLLAGEGCGIDAKGRRLRRGEIEFLPLDQPR